MTAPNPISGNTSGAQAASAPTAPNAANPTTAAAAVSTNGGVTGATKISSMEDLKNKAPEVYKKMMESLAMNICRQVKRADDRRKQAASQYKV